MYVPRNLMHVELEGNLKVQLYGFLYMAIIKYKWFSRGEFNDQIRSFPFLRNTHGNVERPPKVPRVTLKGTELGSCCGGKAPFPSHQARCSNLSCTALKSSDLFSVLKPWPRLSMPPCWSAHVQYFTAMMASTFTDASIAALDGMIFRAQELFLAIEAYSSLWKPKNHFAQHVPNDIKTFGPPRTYWCMRFEAKNQEHKRAGKMSNFRDIFDCSRRESMMNT